MISIGKLATNKCATLQGLKYGAISQNDYGSDIQIDVNNIQSDLNSFDYNRTLNNDNCFALKFKLLENPNDYGSDIQIDVNNIQSNLNSFDYNRTLNNDNCFALKFKSLENPRANFMLQVKVYRFVPYKTYSNKIKVIKKYENKIKG